jgi:predicted O-linked N-acetylglucosamine transferase (SPINDLY family)
MIKSDINKLLIAENHFQNKNYSLSEKILKEIVLCDPKNTKANELLAYALGNQGDTEASFEYLNLACSQNNCSPEALYYLGSMLLDKGSNNQAIDIFKQSISKAGEYFEALHDLGTAYARIGNINEALMYYEKCLKIRTNSHQLYFNIGRILDSLHRHEEAIDHYDRALQLSPNYAEAWLNKGINLADLNRYKEAINHYCKALEIKPNYAEAWYNKGNALKDLGRFKDSITCYENAIKYKPNFSEAWFNKGNAFKELKLFQDAISDFKQTLILEPSTIWAFGEFIHLKMQTCSWDNFNKNLNKIIDDINQNKKVIEPFALHSLIDDPLLQKKCAEIYSKENYQINFEDYLITKNYNNKKIKIAYFSADFRNHPVSFLTAELFELHDKGLIELIGFSFGPDDKSDIRTRIYNSFDQFIDVSNISDFEVVKLGREINIDIAIDLGGFTSKNRAGIFAFRVAPIQVVYLGFLGTMGSTFMDYIIADNVLIPENFQQFYSEKIIYLPSYQANDRKRLISEKKFTRDEFGLPKDGFVFCCFNNNYKILPSTFDSWMRILKAVDNSVLFLYAENNISKNNLINEALIRGVSSHRLIFCGHLSIDDYRARYQVCDLFLDTYPYNAGTTASDALWSGLPVITLMGNSFPSRMAASLLNAVGLKNLITTSHNDYTELAIKLATTPQILADIRKTLIKNRDSLPLFDTTNFVKNLELAYQKVYYCHKSGGKPENIYIDK